ncbi:histidine kinase [Desulfotomaculum copahuensis]|nr:histidine kinase [Desulfotomaculum copahuensis]
MTREEEIRTLEQRIADLRRRLPAHSVRPHMLQELEELEEALERLQAEAEGTPRAK